MPKSHPGVTAPPISVRLFILVLVPRPETQHQFHPIDKRGEKSGLPSDDEIVALCVQGNPIALVMDVP